MSSAYGVEVKTRVTGTGPISSTVSAMELDISYNDRSFGRMSLPAFKTQHHGTEVEVPEQHVKITDMPAYVAYVQSIVTSKETLFRLGNGTCKVHALGLRAKCDFCREFSIPGMNGPQGVLSGLSRNGDEISLAVKCHNPSPVEIDQGDCTFEFRNDRDEVAAEVQGRVDIVRGEFEVVLKGALKGSAAPSSRMSLKGTGAKGSHWRNETAKFVNVEVELKPDFLKLLEGR